MEAPTYRVTWVSSEGESCHTDGALVLVNQEQVIVTHGEKAICCIPRTAEGLCIQRMTPAAAANGDSSTDTAATTPVKSAVTDGRDASGNWMFEGDY